MKKITQLKKGTRIVLTKTEVKAGSKSDFKPGEKRSGTLSQDVCSGKPLRFREWDGGHVTSKIVNVRDEKNGGIILETETSLYSVRIVKDKEDKEFEKWLNH